jgi:hypothetical protein
VDRALVNGLRRAHRELKSRGVDVITRGTFTNATGVNDSYLRSLVQLAFLAPDIQRTILEGRQPPGMTLSWMLEQELPVCWQAQRSLLEL